MERSDASDVAHTRKTGLQRPGFNNLSISLLITLILVVSTMVFVTVGTLASYSLGRDISRSKELDWMHYEASREAEKIADRLRTFGNLMQNLTRDSLVVSTIVDNRGDGRHIAPLIRLISSTLKANYEQDGLLLHSPGISILDYRGRAIASTERTAIPEGTLSGWLPDLMAGDSRSRYDPSARTVIVAMPIIYPATGRPEGILLGRVFLSPPATDNYIRDRWKASVGPPEEIALLSKEQGFLAASGALGLDGAFAGIDLQLLIRAPRSVPDSDAAEHLRSYLLIALALLPLILAFGVFMGRLISAPIAHLARASTGFSLDPDREQSYPTAGMRWATREVARLAETLETTMQRVNESHAESRMIQAALNATTGAVAITDVDDHRVQYVNPAFERQTGYTATEVIGRNLRFLHRFDHTQPQLENVRNALQRGESCSVVLRNWRKDDTEYSNHLTIAPVRDDSGKLVNFIGLQMDITERQQFERAQQNNQKLEALGQLTGGLAHDFNNMLCIIIGNLDLVTERETLPSSVTRRLERAQSAALRAAETTNSLLAVARRQRLEPEPINLDARIDEVMPLILHAAGKRIELRRERCSHDATTLIDAAAFDTVLLNLVLNARDAIGDRNGVIHISVQRRSTDTALGGDAPMEITPGEYLVLDVCDDGEGMIESVRDRAFEPYFTTKPAGEGSGLGLATVYGFARQSGGTATLDTAPGQGTRVSVWLPRSTLADPRTSTSIGTTS